MILITLTRRRRWLTYLVSHSCFIPMTYYELDLVWFLFHFQQQSEGQMINGANSLRCNNNFALDANRKLVGNKEAFNKSTSVQHSHTWTLHTSQVQAASQWIRLTDQRRWVMDSEMKGGERRWNVPACWCQRSCDVSGSGSVSEMPPHCTQFCVTCTHMPKVPLTHELVQTQPAELERRKAARDRYRR